MKRFHVANYRIDLLETSRLFLHQPWKLIKYARIWVEYKTKREFTLAVFTTWLCKSRESTFFILLHVTHVLSRTILPVYQDCYFQATTERSVILLRNFLGDRYVNVVINKWTSKEPFPFNSYQYLPLIEPFYFPRTPLATNTRPTTRPLNDSWSDYSKRR